jgi:hypothetical protein
MDLRLRTKTPSAPLVVASHRTVCLAITCGELIPATRLDMRQVSITVSPRPRRQPSASPMPTEDVDALRPRC